MGKDSEYFKVALVGGDAREQYVIQQLMRENLELHILGLPQDFAQGALVAETLVGALSEADVLILPMPGINAQGHVHSPLSDEKITLTKEALAKMKASATIFTGIAREQLRELAQQTGHVLVEVAEQDEFAILNSIPSAEGALGIALQQSNITIHGSQCVLIGFGRLGITLARMLKGLGAQVQVVARSGAGRARALEMGCTAFDFDRLKSALDQAAFIFNTVPVPLLREQELAVIGPAETVIIDLASAPGGVDLELAKKYGVKAIFAPGLPGKTAPKSAGQILGALYSRLIRDMQKQKGISKRSGGVVA